MIQRRRTAWVGIAAAVLAGEQLAWFILHPITALGSVMLGLVVLLAWLLLGGSRVAWVLAVFVAAGQLIAPFTFDASIWFAALAVIVLTCLFVPSSRVFVWAGKQQRPRDLGSARQVAQRIYDKFLSAVYRLLVRVVQVPWLRGKGTLLLVLGVLIARPLVGSFYDFHHGSAQGNILVDVLWRVVWIGYSLAELAAIVLVLMAAYRYVNKMMGNFKASRAQAK
jgi:hypothetical protein